MKFTDSRLIEETAITAKDSEDNDIQILVKGNNDGVSLAVVCDIIELLQKFKFTEISHAIEERA